MVLTSTAPILSCEFLDQTDIDYEKRGADYPITDEVGNGTVDLRGRPSVKSKTGKWKATGFIHALLAADTLSMPGLAGNMDPYLFATLHESVAESSNTISNAMGVTYVLPLFWGYLADSYISKYYIIVIGAIICTTGWVVLLVSVCLPSLKPPSCTPTADNPTCRRASQSTINWFNAGLFMISVGSAGLKPCMTAMAKDQFDETDPIEKKRGEPFFSSYYWNLSATSVLVATVIVYLQSNVGFNWGWGVEAGLYALMLTVFFSGTVFLRHTKPAGSALTRLFQVLVVAVKNARKPVPSDVSQLYETDEFYSNKERIPRIRHTDRLRFFDKAAIKPESLGGDQGAPPGRWEVCTLTQVEELKTTLQILPIWLTTIIAFTLYAQITGVTLSQAATLDRKLGPHSTLPTASAIIFLMITSVIFIPILEFVIIPNLSKLTGNPRGLSQLKYMGMGLFLTMLSMIVAAQVEQKRVDTIKNRNISQLQLAQGVSIPMSIFWLLPQYAIFGVSDVLLGVNQLNFFYAETPEHMSSIATSLYFSSVSIGYFISTALVNLVNKYTKSTGGWLAIQFNSGGLRNYYYLLAVMQAINLTAFIAFAHWYTHKKVLPGIELVPDFKEKSLQLMETNQGLASESGSESQSKSPQNGETSVPYELPEVQPR